MRRRTRFIGLAALLWPLLLGAQTDRQITAILERLDRLERENRALADEVKTLRARLEASSDSANAASTSAAAAVPLSETAADSPAAQPLAEKVDVLTARVDEMAQTKVEASQRFPIRLAGIALLNAFSNSRDGGSAEYPAVAGGPGPRAAGATMRQTMIGLEYRGPETSWGGRVHGSVFMDFAAGANNAAMRFRTGSIAIDWATRSFTVGIEKPIFNPREPSSLAQMAISPLTGSGNLWLWLPQARFEQDFAFGRASGLRARIGVLQTREVPPYTESGTFNGPLESARPAIEGRFELFHNFDDNRKIEIAPGFHTSTTHAAGTSVTSQLFSTDWFVNPWRRVELSGAFYTGQNVAPLGNGYGQGFGLYYGKARAVGSIGGWAQLTVHAAPRVDLHLFSGQQDDTNSDLDTGRIGKNLTWGGNVYYRLAPNVLLAFEATQLRTFYIGQRPRINDHYDLALAYFF